MPSPTRPLLVRLSALVLALLLCACGQDAGSLNAQGLRAVRYHAFVDAGYFFDFAQERIDRDLAHGKVPGPTHPEQRRTRLGRLALGVWSDAPRFPERLRAELTEHAGEWLAEDYAFLANQALEAKLAVEAGLILDLARQAGVESKALAALRAEVEPGRQAELAAHPEWQPPGAAEFLAGAELGRAKYPTAPPEFQPGADPKSFH